MNNEQLELANILFIRKVKGDSNYVYHNEDAVELWDNFATGALSGLLADNNVSGSWKLFVSMAYDLADNMMLERNKRLDSLEGMV